jgi:hypothetical protein
MSEIKGPKGVDGVGKIHRAGSVDGARSVEAAAEVGATAAVDPITALFERVIADLHASGVTDRAEAVRGIVEEVLSEQMPHLTPAARATVAGEVTDSMLSNAALSARLDRLLQPG